MVDAAIVKIWGETVGAIRWDAQQQLASFEYDKKFIATGWDLSPLKMPLSNGDRIYRFPELRKAKNETVSTFKGLPGLLADTPPVKPWKLGGPEVRNRKERPRVKLVTGAKS